MKESFVKPLLESIMAFKKSICLVGSILATSTAFAAENNTETAAPAPSSKINLDVLGGIGYTNYSNLKDDDSSSSSSSNNMNGFNVNASALYSIMETKIGAPVVGLGLNYTRTTNDQTIGNSYRSASAKTTLNTMAVVANAGFKFVPAEKFAIFTLANLGYGFYNNFSTELSDSKGNSGSIDYKVKNHFLYGVSVIGAYEVAQNFSVGAGLTFNRHSFKMDEVTVSLAGLSGTSYVNSNLSFNEFSANLTAAYSL
jgi:hypothetical protein